MGEGCGAAYLEISIGRLSTGQSLTDAVHEVFGLAAARDGADGLFLELDGHCDDRRGLGEDRVQEGRGVIRLRLDAPRRN
ncbi:hypothetical protein C9974_13355 [Marinobacter sp. B9-2]|nr:hypothetical protein C9974_13355 [Marinobacter sp. B9-2]